MATVEYRPVLVCREGSRCLRLYSDEPGPHEHVVARPSGPFLDEKSAREAARNMAAKVYGSEHDIVVEVRTVTEWVR